MNLVYIASPLRGDIESNIAKAKEYCSYATMCGYIPICPHIYFTQFLDDNIETQREKGMRMGLELLSRCNEVWVFGDTISEAMQKEIEEANRVGVPVS